MNSLKQHKKYRRTCGNHIVASTTAVIVQERKMQNDKSMILSDQGERLFDKVRNTWTETFY